MADLAKYMRIYDPSPADESVTKRKAAAKEVAAQLRKTAGAAELVKLGASIARSFISGSVPEPLGAAVAEAIQKNAPSFIREERELEVMVIAAATTAHTCAVFISCQASPFVSNHGVCTTTC